jgi:hypothetical protein
MLVRSALYLLLILLTICSANFIKKIIMPSPATRDVLGKLATRPEWLAALDSLPDLTATDGKIPSFFCMQAPSEFRHPPLTCSMRFTF